MTSHSGTADIPTQTRSCHECSRRKVRCDKRQPCRHCARTGVQCEFPRFRRRPTRRTQTAGSNRGTDAIGDGPDTQSGNASRSSMGLATEPHRLVHNQRRSQYIGNTFWNSMSRDVSEWRDVLDESSASQSSDIEGKENETGNQPGRPSSFSSNVDSITEYRDTHPTSVPSSSPGILGLSDGDSFIFRPVSSSANALHALHPSESQLLTIWDIFSESIDPVAKIFHRDVIRAIVLDPLRKSQQLDRVGETVMFSVFFAALVSLTAHDCQRVFGQNQTSVIARYRFAVEQSLARARFLQSQNFNLLSALVLFLLCVRRHDNSRFVSSMLGVAIRNAQAVGMHRDGTNFQLSPFKTEMRRRVWWHISVLDLRCSEDHGSDPTILDCSHDTKFPSNVNDCDLTIDMVDPPKIKERLTDMTFCLVRFEVCIAIRKLHYRDPLHQQVHEQARTDLNKHELVLGIEKHLHETYIDKCDITQPAHWVSATWARMLLAKMWLTVYASHASADTEALNNQGQLAFTRAIELLQLSNLLETSPRAARWQWLFLTHTRWHAVVFVLVFLCQQPKHPQSSEAWSLVHTTYTRWIGSSTSKKGMLWKPLHQLLRKAERARNGDQTQVPETESGPPRPTPEIMRAVGEHANTLDAHQRSYDLPANVSISAAGPSNNVNPLDLDGEGTSHNDDELNDWLQWDWNDPSLDLLVANDGGLPDIAGKDPSQVLTDMFGPNFRPRYV